MKALLFISVLLAFLFSCTPKEEHSKAMHFEMDALIPIHKEITSYSETLYVPAYADVYHIDQSRLFPLTTTLSLRNMGMVDSIFIYRVNYYNTKGQLVETHIDDGTMLSLGPLESYDLVVEKRKKISGTGDNFIVEWGRTKGTSKLLVEAVMVSTSGQQGLSFITEGKVITTSK